MLRGLKTYNLKSCSEKMKFVTWASQRLLTYMNPRSFDQNVKLSGQKTKKQKKNKNKTKQDGVLSLPYFCYILFDLHLTGT